MFAAVPAGCVVSKVQLAIRLAWAVAATKTVVTSTLAGSMPRAVARSRRLLRVQVVKLIRLLRKKDLAYCCQKQPHIPAELVQTPRRNSGFRSGLGPDHAVGWRFYVTGSTNRCQKTPNQFSLQ